MFTVAVIGIGKRPAADANRLSASPPQGARGIFLAGDDISWTPGWVEGAVQTSLNAVWGILHHLGGRSHRSNPGPGDRFQELKPLHLPD